MLFAFLSDKFRQLNTSTVVIIVVVVVVAICVDVIVVCDWRYNVAVGVVARSASTTQLNCGSNCSIGNFNTLRFYLALS